MIFLNLIELFKLKYYKIKIELDGLSHQKKNLKNF
jgi:hypothetical protein